MIKESGALFSKRSQLLSLAATISVQQYYAAVQQQYISSGATAAVFQALAVVLITACTCVIGAQQQQVLGEVIEPRR